MFEEQIEKEVGRINGILGSKDILLYKTINKGAYNLFLQKTLHNKTIRTLIYANISEMECKLLLENIKEIRSNNFVSIARCF